jgi:hypothetical protein
VVGHQTVSIACTWVLIQTRVDTILVATGTVIWAFRVRPTANDFTGNKWIPFIARYTAAVGLVPGRVAFSKPATGIIH